MFIVSDSDASYTDSVLNKTLETLKKTKGLEAQAGSPSNSLEALQGLRGSQVAVLAVTMKNSLPNVVRDEYAVCEENSIPVVANFVIYPQR